MRSDLNEPRSVRGAAAPRPARNTLRLLALATATIAAGLVGYACSDGAAAPIDRTTRLYGPALSVGNGQARTYVLLDNSAGGRPLEMGVALDEAALEGLPTPAHGDGSHPMHVFDLELPARHGTQYRFVQLDWSPTGHEPPGVYDLPHFDFHFYVISKAERDSIDTGVLGATQYQAQADNLPPEAERSATYVPLGPPGGPVASVPRMGVHWGSTDAPELQGAFGHPEAARPFTTTFLRGSWDGDVTFDEPMVTRDFILSRKAATAAAARDSVIPIPSAERYRPAGYYPAAYRVRYDAEAKQYHIALTQLTKRD